MRCTRLLGVAALAVPLAVPAAPEGASSSWCEFGQRPGETFPAPRLNLPAWVCQSASAAKLHAKYTIYSGINPFFLAGDFNGDGRLDVAVWVMDEKTHKLGLVMFHGGSTKVFVVAAGVPWEPKRVDDFSGLNMWSVLPKGTVLDSRYEKKRVRLKGDAIGLAKAESASFALYWNGAAYSAYQLTD